jgi:hypothetical protein
VTTEQAGGRVAAGQSALPHVEGLVTARYAAVDPRVWVPVQTSIGRPGWIGFELVEWPTVYPWGLVGEMDPGLFRRKYRYRLHQRTSRVLGELAELRATYDGWPLALCCFEDLRKPDAWCHRTILAGWLAQHLGGEIPDVEVMPEQD